MARADRHRGPAGAARIAPLVYCYQDDLDRLLKSVRQQTGFTHRTAEVVAGAEFFAAPPVCSRRPATVEAMTALRMRPAAAIRSSGGFSRFAKRAEDSRSAIRALARCARWRRLPATFTSSRNSRIDWRRPDRKRDGGRDSAGRGLLAVWFSRARRPAALPNAGAKPECPAGDERMLARLMHPSGSAIAFNDRSRTSREDIPHGARGSSAPS